MPSGGGGVASRSAGHAFYDPDNLPEQGDDVWNHMMEVDLYHTLGEDMLEVYGRVSFDTSPTLHLARGERALMRPAPSTPLQCCTSHLCVGHADVSPETDARRAVVIEPLYSDNRLPYTRPMKIKWKLYAADDGEDVGVQVGKLVSLCRVCPDPILESFASQERR